MPIDEKFSRYSALVADRKNCDLCLATGLFNPSQIQAGNLDSDEIGPWSRWNGDLDARIFIVGQEWGDVAAFEKQHGLDKPSPTNDMLKELLSSVGISIETAPRKKAKCGVFQTNAALCLKTGGAQAPVKSSWFTNCRKAFLRKQIEIIKPKVIVTLGKRAYISIRDEFNLDKTLSFREVVNAHKPISIPNIGHLVPVYHCGQFVLNTHRPKQLQFQDWLPIRNLL